MEPGFSLTRDEVRQLDHRAITGYGVPGVVLMENAGRGCAELLMRLNPDRSPVLILCGPGNNGGDGSVIARHLDNHGWPVHVLLFARNDGLSGDAATNFNIVVDSGIPYTQCHPDFFGEPQRSVVERHNVAPAGWVVDALFGTGLTRPLADPYVWVADVVNRSGKPVLAIDIPSGLDCDTGEPLGPVVNATHTATFVALKKGYLNPRSHEWTGEIHVIDIGAPRVLIDEYRHRSGTPTSPGRN